jgi:hypothetical protein
MAGDGFVRFAMDGGEGWEVIKFIRPMPRDGDSWGVLRHLEGTVWERSINFVLGEDLSHALHGYPMPLIRSLVYPPQRAIKDLPDESSFCRHYLNKGCMIRTKNCRPGLTLPVCYEAPGVSGEAAHAANAIAEALQKERYVIVAEGEEFSLT